MTNLSALLFTTLLALSCWHSQAKTSPDEAKIEALIKERLHLAAHLNDVTSVMELLDDGADPNSRDSYSWSPVMRGASAGSADAIEALANHGADVNLFDSGGWTATLEAASGGHADAVRALIAAGASLNHKDSKHGWTALHRASAMGCLGCVEQLLKAGAEVDAVSLDGSTALTMSASGKIALALLKAGGDLEHVDDYGFTPLASAVLRFNLETAQALVEAGANCNAKDTHGTSILEWLGRAPAVGEQGGVKTDCEELLLDCGAGDDFGVEPEATPRGEL